MEKERGAAHEGGATGTGLLDEEHGENAEAFGECHAENRLNEDLRRSAGITTDGLGGLHADKTDADGRRDEGTGDADVAGEFCEHWDHGGFFFLLVGVPPSTHVAWSRREM